jgi:colanic acid/amylovoran biosynthesis protein
VLDDRNVQQATSYQTLSIKNPLLDQQMKFIVLGASIQSTNRGVSALGTACVDNLSRAFPSASIILGERGVDLSRQLQFHDRLVHYETNWLNSSPSVTTRSSVGHLKLLEKLRCVAPGLGTKWFKNRTLKQFIDSDAVCDISGGDSFAEIYGSKVFNGQCHQKELAIRLKKPLILLPQTIGPFTTSYAKDRARNILDKACLVATREVDGLSELEQWNGNLDHRFIRCPDLAISMAPFAIPDFQLPFHNENGGTLIGLNVSGLLWESNADFSVAANYRELVWRLIEWSLEHTKNKLLLLPHVFNPRRQAVVSSGGLNEYPELELTGEIVREAKTRWGSRVAAIDQPYSAPQLKWIIGKCDFFIGARMHSCIAGLSQGVPTVTLAYSKKATGVLGMLNAEDLVVDLRSMNADEAVRRVHEIYEARSHWRDHLLARREIALSEIEKFFHEALPKALSNVLNEA